jgi:predicted nucleotidyltransferase
MSDVTGSSVERVNGIFVSAHEFGIIAEILRKHAAGRKVWAFGSRATGERLKLFSDLDLAIEGRLMLEQQIGLGADFDESLLPFKVDLVELGAVDAAFRSRIELDFREVAF